MPSSSQSSFSQRKIPIYKPLKPTSLHRSSTIRFKTQKPASPAITAAKLEAATQILHAPSSSSAGKNRDPREIFRDPDASLNERIGALAKTQWTRMEKLDCMESQSREMKGRLDETLASVQSIAETVEECKESSATTLDAMYVLREECMSASMGESLLRMMEGLEKRCRELWEQGEGLRRQREVDGGVMERIAERLERVEEELRAKPQGAGASAVKACCCGCPPKEKVDCVAESPLKKPRRSTRARKSAK